MQVPSIDLLYGRAVVVRGKGPKGRLVPLFPVTA